MVDIGHGMNSIVEAPSKITRNMGCSLEYLQSDQVAKQNSTGEEEPFSEKDKQDTTKPPGYEQADFRFEWALLRYRRLLAVVVACYAILFRLVGVLISSVVTVSGNRAHLHNRRRWWLCTLEAAAVVLDKFIIMGAHAARSCRTVIKYSFFARHGGKKVASEASETLECVRQSLVTFAALLAAVICLAGLSTPDALFLSDIQDDDEHLPGDRASMLHNMVAMAFHCFNSVSSLVVLTLLMRRAVTGHRHGFCSRALWVCTTASLIGLTLVFSIWSRRSLTTSICFSALLVLLVPEFAWKTMENGGRYTEEKLQKCLKHWDTAELQANATDGLHHYHAGDQIPHTTYRRMYQAFFYLNATAFVASLAILIALLSSICRTRGIMNCALQVALILDFLGMIGAHATGSCSESADPAVTEDDPNSPIKGTPLEATWRVACAAPHHMTGNQSLLLTGSYMPVHGGNDGEVVMVHLATNGEAVPLRVQGSGSVRTESITLDDVWYVPGLDSNLVSTGQLARQGCAINLDSSGGRITIGETLVGTAHFTEACQFELDFLKVA